MKQLLAVLLICVSLSVFSQQNGLGIGVIIGEPTGISFKKFVGDDAFDAAAAWSVSNDYFYAHVDYLKHTYVISDNIPFYVGIGGGVGFGNDLALLARVPLGISYLFRGPFEIFGELAPALVLIPNTDFNLMGGGGFRFYLN